MSITPSSETSWNFKSNDSQDSFSLCDLSSISSYSIDFFPVTYAFPEMAPSKAKKEGGFVGQSSHQHPYTH